MKGQHAFCNGRVSGKEILNDQSEIPGKLSLPSSVLSIEPLNAYMQSMPASMLLTPLLTGLCHALELPQGSVVKSCPISIS